MSLQQFFKLPVKMNIFTNSIQTCKFQKNKCRLNSNWFQTLCKLYFCLVNDKIYLGNINEGHMVSRSSQHNNYSDICCINKPIIESLFLPFVLAIHIERNNRFHYGQPSIVHNQQTSFAYILKFHWLNYVDLIGSCWLLCCPVSWMFFLQLELAVAGTCTKRQG